VRGAVVDHPEHTLGRSVGLGSHHLFDQAAEGLDPGLLLDSAEEVGVVDVPGGQVGEGAAAAVVELDQGRAAGPGRERGVATTERLQLGLLIGRDHVLVRAQALAFEAPLVEVEHPRRLGGEVGVAHEQPGALLPGPDRVVVKPTPDRRGRGVGDTSLDHQPVQLSAREAAERQAVGGRQLAGDRLDLGDLLRGENGAGAPRVGDQ